MLQVWNVEIAYGGVVMVGPVDLDVATAEIVGLVGESGGGKSTLSKAILGDLPDAAAVVGGTIQFDQTSLVPYREEIWSSVRWKQIAYIPQAALNVLNPVRTIGAQFADMLADHQGARLADTWRTRVLDVLVAVRLDADVLARFPHELSGGMRQRVCIAMAMLFRPRLIVADEPTSALDVVSQRLVLETLGKMRDDLKTAILLIGHDLAIMAQVVDRIGILFSGQLVEIGPVGAVFGAPAHPYTQMLLKSVPSIRSKTELPALSTAASENRSEWASRAIPMRAVGPGHFARLGQ